MSQQLPFSVPESELIMTLSTLATMKHIDSIAQELMLSFKNDGYELEDVLVEVALLGFDPQRIQDNVIDFLQILMVLASELYPELL